ncbi:hypothetical protein [Undibacterium sp. KW1]|uniref:hypothetical protein n=1 Tax=Undibacterium sp. KW1 TaxID=2058624 RepID=UPI001E2EE2A3|nr:hypothetical protein [Undibacterium sp. KW1]
MPTSFLFITLLSIPLITAASPDFHLEKLEENEPKFTGAQCEFSYAKKVILKADWASKLWVKIDGKPIILDSITKAGNSHANDSKTWRETFLGQGISVTLHLKRTGAGEDTASYRGNILVKRDAQEKKFLVEGGCGA